DLSKEPCVIDEARWLDERNAGAASMAKAILEDDGRGEMSPGLCADALRMVRELRRQLEDCRADNAAMIQAAHSLMADCRSLPTETYARLCTAMDILRHQTRRGAGSS